jgi:hypothetical protein
MKRLGPILQLLTGGILGAALSIFLLHLIPAGDVAVGFGTSIADELPALVFAGGIGFVVGALIALLWSALRRYFAISAPQT